MNIQRYDIIDTTYHLHHEPDDSTSVEVRYVTMIRYGERLRTFSEYLNFEHEQLKKVAAKWWKARSPDPLPKTNQHAVDIANYHGVAISTQLEVNYDETGYKIKEVTTGEKPAGISEIW
jgi:hypothetical protein